ncbi:unnamed protein product [Effrenium voratum]|nr:unnamed protein product [Effrenium voratum]
MEYEAACCNDPPSEECGAPPMMPLRAACCGHLAQGIARFSSEWDQLQRGLESAALELLRLVEASTCAACDPFQHAAEVAFSSVLAPVFRFGWSDLTDDGEFGLQASRQSGRC